MQADGSEDASRNEKTAEPTAPDPGPAPALSSPNSTTLSQCPSASSRGIFNTGTTVLVHFNEGSTTGESTVLELEMGGDGQDDILNRWKTRGDHFKNTEHYTCLSLACYTKEDLGEIDMEDEDQLKTTLLGLTPKWPTNARLQAFIGSIRTFLAPPLLTTDENFVDISNYVQDKNVTMKIEYHADYSQYVFAVYCHPPTPSQLRVLEERREKEKKWQNFLVDAKKPFTIEELFGNLLPKI